MRYMLLIHTDESALPDSPPDTATAVSADYVAFNEAMRKAGVLMGGERLHASGGAASVRIRNGRQQVLDGPYADTKEQFAGYYTIEVPSQDEAVAWAARCPGARTGTVEVRAIRELADR